jgi:hypothetical protein
MRIVLLLGLLFIWSGVMAHLVTKSDPQAVSSNRAFFESVAGPLLAAGAACVLIGAAFQIESGL